MTVRRGERRGVPKVGTKVPTSLLGVEASKETNPASPVASDFLLEIALTLRSCDHSWSLMLRPRLLNGQVLTSARSNQHSV